MLVVIPAVATLRKYWSLTEAVSRRAILVWRMASTAWGIPDSMPMSRANSLPVPRGITARVVFELVSCWAARLRVPSPPPIMARSTSSLIAALRCWVNSSALVKHWACSRGIWLCLRRAWASLNPCWPDLAPEFPKKTVLILGHGLGFVNSWDIVCVCRDVNSLLLAVLAVGALTVTGIVALSGGGQDAKLQEGVKIGGLTVENKSPMREDKVVLSDAEWKKKLTPEQYKILRAKGTEAAFCGGHLDEKRKGVFHCVGCDLPLFKSDTKFESGTGWPSFFQPYDRKNVWLKSDYSYGMSRVEVLCSRCDGHLGHVFTDGPSDKTGLRYCINGDILTFKPADKAVDKLENQS